jgi:hypothetical protein
MATTAYPGAIVRCPAFDLPDVKSDTAANVSGYDVIV